jgi:hypothetical protein
LRKVILILFLSLFSIISFSSVEDIFKEELNKNIQLKESENNLKNIEINIKKKNNFFIPYMSIKSSPFVMLNNQNSDSINFNILNVQKTLNDYTYSTKLYLNFTELYGAQLGMTLPFGYNEDENKFQIGNLGLSISRDLKKEPEVEKLNLEANYYDAIYSIKKTKNSIYISTINSIINKNNNEELMNLNMKKLELLVKKYEYLKDEDEREKVELDIIKTKKSIQSLKDKQENFDYDIDKKTYEEALNLLKKYDEKINMNYIQREDIKALNKRVEAAKIQETFWFLPYLPDMSVAFNINDLENFKWSLTFDLNLNVLDFGEKEQLANTRKNNYSDLKVKEKIDSIERTIKSYLNDIRINEFDKKINASNLKQSKENILKNRKLFENGFMSELDYDLYEIDYRINEINFESSNLTDNFNYMNIASENGEALWGDLVE